MASMEETPSSGLVIIIDDEETIKGIWGRFGADTVSEFPIVFSFLSVFGILVFYWKRRSNWDWDFTIEVSDFLFFQTFLTINLEFALNIGKNIQFFIILDLGNFHGEKYKIKR